MPVTAEHNENESDASVTKDGTDHGNKPYYGYCVQKNNIIIFQLQMMQQVPLQLALIENEKSTTA